MIFEMRNDGIGTYALLAADYPDDALRSIFKIDGKPLSWPMAPKVMPAPERAKKKLKPRADITGFGMVLWC